MNNSRQKGIGTQFFFSVGRIALDTARLIEHCLLSPQVVVLLVVLTATWLIGCGAGCYANVKNPGIWSLRHMFDLGQVIATLEAGTGWQRIATVIPLFVVTWLIGGGVMLGVLIDNGRGYLARIREGRTRYCFCHRGHHVILGWDPNALTIMREIIPHDGKPKRPFEQFVIISQKPAVEINQEIDAAFGRNKIFAHRPFHVRVYNGIFDSDAELKQIMPETASEVIVLGEHNEDAHDARTMTFLSHLDAHYKAVSTVRCYARIASYPLYCLLLRERERRYDHLDVTFFNFYENWAKRIWSALPPAHGISYDPLCRFADARKRIRLVIVGFEKMGQALLVEAVRIAHYGDGRVFEIMVYDANISTHLRRFLRLFPALSPQDKRGNAIAITSSSALQFPMMCRKFAETGVHDVVYTDQYPEFLNSPVADDVVTVALTSSATDDVMTYAHTISVKTQRTVNILIRQDISHANVDAVRTELERAESRAQIRYFGFQGGAGFYSMDREGLAERNFMERYRKNRHERQMMGADVRPWADLDEYVRMKFRHSLDAIGEILSASGLVLKPIVKDVDEGSEVNEFDNVDVQARLAEAFHNRWWAEMLLNDCVSTCMVPYQKLKERVGDVDMETVRTLPEVLKSVNLKITRV